MLIFLIVVVSGFTCKEKLEEKLNQDLQSRIASYNSEGKGLDYLSPIEKCKGSKESTYLMIIWQTHSFPLISYGLCMPDECLPTDAVSLINSETFPYLKDINIGNLSVITINLQNNAEYSATSVIFFTMFVALLGLTLLSTCFSGLIRKKTSKSSESLSKTLLTCVLLLKIFPFLMECERFVQFQF
jgi:hypothetical protein